MSAPADRRSGPELLVVRGRALAIALPERVPDRALLPELDVWPPSGAQTPQQPLPEKSMMAVMTNARANSAMA